jgi:threonine/homoserine/homoserine lactone efflux protein
MVMGITFLVIEIASIILYAFGGRWLQRRLKKHKNSRWLSRISALALSAAAGLVLIP